ncbi:IBR domain protein (macronuclear) [Tetrahymena thermophila SB210]|uniref:RBR-type E3 ubiquitin transferase n=1 Tax=Tetrahymena thermophila (strain SB210) TaxID=312017 RepID=Q229A4_TETTS|nr:IBR domain protein [Tetrahymena thermophila SB210]EAR81869.2 IBR domain protein [Tetrahymena thermophila SB210]|eukprot:XP_001029532.2 IBR domain protein [Tetrahymena thermophila SB210]
MSVEVIQNFEINDLKQMLVFISLAEEGREQFEFLAGTRYAYSQVDRSSLSAQVAKFLQVSQQNGQNEIKQELFASLINKASQKPFRYIEELSKSINQQKISINNSESNNQDKKSVQDDENEEEEEKQKDIKDNKDKSNEIPFNERYNTYYMCNICFDQTVSEQFFCLDYNFLIKCPCTDCCYQIPYQILSEVLNKDELEAYELKSLTTFLSQNQAQLLKDKISDKNQNISSYNTKIDTEQKQSEINQIQALDVEDNWVCEICYENMISQDYMSLNCDHIFHKNCLAKYFTSQINEKKFPLKCPNSNCIFPIEQQDLREVLNEIEIQRYEKFSLQNYIDSNADEISWCPTPNCEFAFIIEKDQNQLSCPKCNKSYCLNCKCDFHFGQTCQEYKISYNFSEDDQKFEQFVIGQKFKKCSKCKMWVEKNQGLSNNQQNRQQQNIFQYQMNNSSRANNFEQLNNNRNHINPNQMNINQFQTSNTLNNSLNSQDQIINQNRDNNDFDDFISQNELFYFNRDHNNQNQNIYDSRNRLHQNLRNQLQIVSNQNNQMGFNTNEISQIQKNTLTQQNKKNKTKSSNNISLQSNEDEDQDI